MPVHTHYMEFEVRLEDVEPPIWRRFLLRADATFHDLHDTIQRACGWLDYHLYAFQPEHSRENLAVSPYYEPWDDAEEVPVGTEVPLETFFRETGDTAIYEYDFGDSWQHRVTLTGFQQCAGTKRRILLAGARAFPPEDCGGVRGYYECLEAARITEEELARQDEEIQEMLRERRVWFGDWDPEHFDLDAVQRQMRRPVNL